VARLTFTPIQFGLRNLPLAAMDILIVWVTIIWMSFVIWKHQKWIEGRKTNSMIFRLSQKLSTKIKAGKVAEKSLDENPYADWSVPLFVVDRTQYIILSNTASMYSCVKYKHLCVSPVA